MSLFDRGGRGNIVNPFESVAGATDAGNISYNNPRIIPDFNGNVEGALNYLLDAVYPNYKGTVPTYADLPANPAVNDFYIVSDDGDGNSAGYVWSSIAGVDTWIKRYDVDWSYDQILADTIDRTSYLYAAKYGYTDKDASGAEITGLYAGQRIYGGAKTNENFTLTANVKDSTGFIQVDNVFRPTSDNAFDIGTTTKQWRIGYFGTGVAVSTLTIAGGSILDSTGSITFGSADLSTTGTLASGTHTIGGLVLASGSITDSSGTISFGATNLTTTGTVTAAANSVLADITFTNGTFNTASSSFSFSNKDVAGIGTLTSSKVVTDEVDVGNLVLSGQTLKTNADATDLFLQAGNGGPTTTVEVESKVKLVYNTELYGALVGINNVDHVLTGTLKVGTLIKLSGYSGALLESVAGDLKITSASSVISITGSLRPATNGTYDLGSTAYRWRDLYLSGSIGDGTDSISMANLLTLRNINTSVTNGMSLFYDAVTGTWKPSLPDTEITHSTLGGLTTGDAGHTQFVMLDGRSGGQTIKGGTSANESLVLDSTSDSTKGFVLVSSVFAPYTDANYSGGWLGTDIGSSSRNFRDMYSKGIHYGLRFDQYAGSGAYPANSGTSVGRVIWDTNLNQLLVDTGTNWSSVGGGQKFVSDTSWDGSTTSKSIDVSANITDARNAIWQLTDNTNSFEQVFAKITCTQTHVTITVSPALPAGSYRLIGLN